ncbi:hypothetical protein M406DRAFT_68364 [Cryphonectria parasitica EP155]|uniref:Beta-lactamase-related domain-containing protein n=1 Tax=Cryphonectria parasitica (strain ATCC 38755 / EP155) TaxID=660469 RepID=A0A9P4Y3R4_CRYP1|nr:uncharacterized protein M406DRAFT_68364 [Cryphonectria parasitica EP155]KAF3765983.1 hypothetical protein M406DRAFT_68364 [Cryphonectria parasitica EP155]
MIQQTRFAHDLAKLLTPLPCRAPNSTHEAGPSQPDVTSWYNTSGVTVAAATSSAAAHDANICHAEWGARQLPSGPTPDAETLFQACSISKPFQSLAILHYISEGAISSLDDPVKLYLSEATYRTLLDTSIRRGMPEKLAAQMLDRMTITQLLSHTAGTSASGFLGYPETSSRVLSTTEILKGGFGNANSPAVYVHALPGVQFEYSGGGSTILQAMLENIGAGDGFGSFAELMKAKVLEPLGMMRSFYCGGVRLPEDEGNYATGYQNGVHALEAGEYHVHPEQGAAGLWTTSVDLVKGITGFAHTLLGTASAIKLNGKPWIRPEVAQVILQKRSELGHGETTYYCGFGVAFFDGEDEFARDEHLVRISHAGGNHGYRCWAAAVLPLPDKIDASQKDNIAIHAQAIMTDSNYGGEIVGPLMAAISEMLDSPLGPGGLATYGEFTPFIALEEETIAAEPSLDAYEGEWEIKDRSQTLRIVTRPKPVVIFSHLQDVELPLWAVAARRGPGFVRLRASSLDVVLDFGAKKGDGEASLTLCTAGSRIKCSKLRSGQ